MLGIIEVSWPLTKTHGRTAEVKIIYIALETHCVVAVVVEMR